MIRQATACAALVATLASTTIAFADKMVVLKADGKADAAVKIRVDGAIAKLAASGTTPSTGGEITYNDAAAAVGCVAEEPACRGDVIDMLGVDEIVAVAVSPKPGGYEVSILRTSKAGTSKDAAVTVDDANLEHLEGLGPVFGLAAPTPIDVIPTPPPVETPPPVVPPPHVVGPVGGEPNDLGPPSHRLQIAGMVAGGALLLVGLLAWGGAASTQKEIDDAPANTAAQIQDLMDLEKRGDNQAALGNVLVLGGLVVGGISTVLYLRHRHDGVRSSTSARLTPMITPHGAGLALTFGGTP